MLYFTKPCLDLFSFLRDVSSKKTWLNQSLQLSPLFGKFWPTLVSGTAYFCHQHSNYT